MCPSCGFEFPEPEKKKLELRDDDIMGIESDEMLVTAWQWRRHVSHRTGAEMLRCTYYGALTDKPIDEYVCILHDGYAGDKARRTLARIAADAGLSPGWSLEQDLEKIAVAMNSATPPAKLRYVKSGKFFDVKGRQW